MGTTLVTERDADALEKLSMPATASGNRIARSTKNAVRFVGRPVWAEVSLAALRHNLNAIRDYVNPASEKRQAPRKVLSIVKGNGYGHGGPEVAKVLGKFGSDWFGVASAGEGMELRKAGVLKPILVLGGFWPGEEKNLIRPFTASSNWHRSKLRLPRRTKNTSQFISSSTRA
jgi:alanine racemase